MFAFLATRLVNGSDQYSGRVEVYNRKESSIFGKYASFAYQWSTIYDSNWTVEDANVVCQSLGYHSSGAIPHSNSSYGEGVGIVRVRNPVCVGTEPYIWNCQRYSVSYNTPPDHSLDAGVSCLCMLMNIIQV